MSTAASSILYVGNFPQHRPESDLRSLFEPFGSITEVSLPEPSHEQLRKKQHPEKGLKGSRNQKRGQQKKEKNNGKKAPLNRGFAFVAFEEMEDASHALQNMDQSEFYGQILKVTWTTRRNFEEGTPELTREEREAFLRDNLVDEETREVFAKAGEEEKDGAPDLGENAQDHQEEEDNMQDTAE